eukprot:360618-Chlamydomonas_euryale.AAC.8
MPWEHCSATASTCHAMKAGPCHESRAEPLPAHAILDGEDAPTADTCPAFHAENQGITNAGPIRTMTTCTSTQ